MRESDCERERGRGTEGGRDSARSEGISRVSVVLLRACDSERLRACETDSRGGRWEFGIWEGEDKLLGGGYSKGKNRARVRE